jgi:PAS domain S-box-containing protein
VPAMYYYTGEKSLTIDSMNLYRNLVETSPNIVVLTDMSGRVHMCNARLFKLTHYEPEFLKNRNIRDIISTDEHCQVTEQITASLLQGKRRKIQCHLRQADGNLLPVELIPSLVQASPQMPEGILFVIADISDRTVRDQQIHTLLQELRSSHQEMQALSRKLMQVQEEERLRLSRELHDGIGQALTAIKIHLQSWDHTSTEQQQKRQQCIEIVDQTLQEVRTLALTLRPSLLDDLGLEAALRWQLNQQTKNSGIKARFSTNLNGQRLPGEVEIACFRVAQEAVNNAIKHARAKTIALRLLLMGEVLTMEVEDDGRGFDTDKAWAKAACGKSMGLLSMKERVALASGQLHLESDFTRGGTLVRVSFPVGGGRDE